MLYQTTASNKANSGSFLATLLSSEAIGSAEHTFCVEKLVQF